MKHGEPRIKIRFWSHKNKILTTHHHDIHDSIPPTKRKVKAGMNALQNMTTFWWLGESRRNQTSGCWIVIVNKHHMFPWLCVWLSEFRGGKVHAVVCNYLGYTFSIIITYYLFLYNYSLYFETCLQWCKQQRKDVSTHPLAASLKPSYSTRWKIQDMTPALADWPSAQENAHFMVRLQQQKSMVIKYVKYDWSHLVDVHP